MNDHDDPTTEQRDLPRLSDDPDPDPGKEVEPDAPAGRGVPEEHPDPPVGGPDAQA